MKGRPIGWQPEELAWIEARRDWPRAQLHRAFCAFWRRDVGPAAIASLCKRMGWLTGRDGRFARGHVSGARLPKGQCHPGSERGWFRPGSVNGHAAALLQPVGAERIGGAAGYRERKVSADAMPVHRRWRAVHLIEWEALHGPVPPCHVLKCIDGDRLNADPANWVAVPRSCLPRLAGRWAMAYDTAPPELRPSLLAIARLEHVARNARAAPLATPTPARGGDGGGGHDAALQVARALAHDRTCPTCAGTGWVQGPEVTTHRGRFRRRGRCPACVGTGRRDAQPGGDDACRDGGGRADAPAPAASTTGMDT